MITSLQNDKVKLVHGLQTRNRTRRKERKIALEGKRLIGDAMERGSRPFFILYEPQSADFEFIAQIQSADPSIQLLEVNEEIMTHLADTQQPQGVIGVFPLPIPQLPRHPRRVLILDNIREPGNLGTILRSAAAAGVDVVALSPGCVDPFNPKAVRSGMGAHFRVPIAESPWYEIAAYCQKLRVYIAAADGNLTYDQVDFTQPHALIIGSEAHGSSPHAVEIATDTVSIPMSAGTESLNAAIAASVLLFEAARQIRLK